MEQNYLVHHGVKGMRWGIRKNRGKSGQKRDKTKDWSDDAKEAHNIGKKKPSQMSNVELRKVNERTRLEQEYSRLNPSKISKGIAAVTAMAAIATTAVNLYNSGSKLAKIGKGAAEKMMDYPIAPVKGGLTLKDLI